jgi:hypothetical protein
LVNLLKRDEGPDTGEESGIIEVDDDDEDNRIEEV